MHPIEFPRGMNPASHFRAARELNRLVERLAPDVIHILVDGQQRIALMAGRVLYIFGLD